MADFQTSFSSNSVGAGVPTGWTNQFGGTTAVSIESGGPLASGKFMRLSSTGDAVRGFSFDAAGTPSNTQILTLLRRGSTQTNASPTVYVKARGSGSSGSESSYDASHLHDSGGTDDVRISEDNAGSFAVLSSASDRLEVSSTDWFAIIFDLQSTTLRMKAWVPADPTDMLADVPASWEASTTDATHASGWAGLGLFTGSRVIDCAFYEVATAGDAVIGPTGTSPPTANAGSDQTVNEGATVNLDGSASTAGA